MLIEYDMQQLGQALNDFYNALGINISFRDTNFEIIGCRESTAREFCQCVQTTEEGMRRCCMSDERLFQRCQESRHLEIHTCHAGLIDVAVPIIQNDFIIGYILLGQMKQTPDFASIASLLSWPGADIAALRSCYEQLPYFNHQKIESVANLAVMLVKYILLCEMLKPQHDRNMEAATAYIRHNLHQELTAPLICQNIGISKSVLYKIFRKHFNCTVSEYINTQRVKRAKELILSESLSMEEVALRVGFSDLSYFCKTFKKLTGKTPLQYKKIDH